MSTIIATVASIVEDGHISTNELRELVSEILADGEISSVEFAAFADMLNKVSGNADNSPALGLTSKLVASIYFLEDTTSPGVLTADEAAELDRLVGADGNIDAIEAGMVNFVKALALTKGQLSRAIMEAPTLADAIAVISADGSIDDNEAKSLYFRVVKDGSVDDEELEALIDLNNQVKGSALWNEIFPVLVLRSVVVDSDEATFDISAEEGEQLKKIAHEVEAIEACIELAETVDPDFADFWEGAKKAA